MHIALCDDDQETLSHLLELVLEYRAAHCPSLSVQAFSSPIALSEQLAQGRFDLLILDVVMPEKSGLVLAQEVRAHSSELPIIFLTSSPEFAVESYRVKAQDYLLKPVDRAMLFATLDEQIRRIAAQECTLVLQTATGIFQVPISRIVYIEAVNHRIYLVRADGSTIKATDTITNIWQNLADYSYFVRPHRSYLVNLRHVTAFENSELRTTTGAMIPVARNQFNHIKLQYLNNLLFET